MAELEVSKSMKKVVHIAKSKEHDTLHKLKEIATEILIIVFAVSLSIFLHTWSENREKQHEVHVFMKGLEQDLEKDIKEMQSDIEAYKNQKKLFQYLSSRTHSQIAHSDSIQKYQPYLYNFTGLGKNNGRYEGFKSSGNIQYIENDILQNEILNHYEETIPLLKISTEYYKGQKIKFADFIIDHTQDYPQGNLMKVISSNPVKNRCKIYLSSVDQIIKGYQSCIDESNRILDLIRKEH